MAQTNTPVSADDQKKIDAFGEQWRAAQAAGDKVGMDAARARRISAPSMVIPGAATGVGGTRLK